MVGGKGDPSIGEADLMAEEGKKVGEFAIEGERHGGHLGRIGADLVAENVVGRKADREKIGGFTAAELFVYDPLFCKFQFVFVGEWSRTDHFIEAGVVA